MLVRKCGMVAAAMARTLLSSLDVKIARPRRRAFFGGGGWDGWMAGEREERGGKAKGEVMGRGERSLFPTQVYFADFYFFDVLN